MSINPNLLKKLSDPQLLQAAGREAILRAEMNSIRSELRAATAALINHQLNVNVVAYCNAVHELLHEYAALAQFMLDSDKQSQPQESNDAN